MIKLIAQNITDKHLSDLGKIHDNMKLALEENNREIFIHEDRNFHMYLAQITNNDRLIQFLDNLSDQVLRLGVRAVTIESRVHETLTEHRELLNALHKRSPSEAVKAMEKHILNTEEVLMKMLETVENREGN